MSPFFALAFLIGTGVAFIAAVVSLFSGAIGASFGLFILSAILNGVAKSFEAKSRTERLRKSSPLSASDAIENGTAAEFKQKAEEVRMSLALLERYKRADKTIPTGDDLPATFEEAEEMRRNSKTSGINVERLDEYVRKKNGY